MIFFAGLCVVFSLALAVKGDTTTSTNATSEKAQLDTLIMTMQNVTAGIDEFSVNIEESFENILATMFYTISNDTNSMYKYITSAVESAETVAEAISGSDAEVLECIESGKNEALLALEEAVQSALECFSTPVSSFETMLDELSAYGTEANTLATNASTAAEACFDGEVLSSAECLSALLIKYGFEYASLVTEVGLKTCHENTTKTSGGYSKCCGNKRYLTWLLIYQQLRNSGQHYWKPGNLVHLFYHRLK